MSTSVAALSVFVVLAATSPAAAQSAPPAAAQSDSAASEPAPTLEDTHCVATERARTNELFQAAIVSWKRGDTDGAVTSMRDAYAVSKCSAFLFVVGEMLHQSENRCDALAWYERYIADAPEVKRRALASERVAELRSQCPVSVGVVEEEPVTRSPSSAKAEPAPKATAVQAGPPPAAMGARRSPPPKYWSAARIGGWAALGASALLTTGAIYFAVRTQNASDDYERVWKSAIADPAQRDEWQRERAELEQRGSSSQTAARVLGGAAAAMAVGGLLLILVNPSADRRQDVALSIDGASMTARYGTRF